MESNRYFLKRIGSKGGKRMSQRTLIMYEISQKQNYILRTNRLLENTGGSYIIRELTEDPHSFLKGLTKEKIIDLNRELPKYENKIVGGGSATYIFKTDEKADEFSKLLSSIIIRHFPGLELFLVKETMDWEGENLFSSKEDGQGIIPKMRDDLSDKKNRRKSTIFQKSWGIHKSCPHTGLPANKYIYNEYKKDYELIAEEVYIKERVGKRVRNNEYEKRFIMDPDPPFQPFENKKYRFMQQKDLEEIFQDDNAKDKGKNYLSIVELDGNAMGLKVQQFLSKKFKTNDEYIKKYQNFTKSIDDAYTRAFQQTIEFVMSSFNNWASKVYGSRMKDEQFVNRFKNIIPIRPVILSGDDVSFITLGELGLEIARVYLQYLQDETIPINNKNYPMNACAGVAIIPHRYPFWLGFELADKLCENGKERLQKDRKYWLKVTNQKDENYDTSLIDWQIIQTGGVIEQLSKYRKENYVSKDSTWLTMRPYYVQHPDEPIHFANYEKAFYRAINIIERSIENPENHEDSQCPGRSKWKELRDVYHQGREAVNDWALLNQFFAKDAQNENDRVLQQFYFPFYTDGENNNDDYGFRLINDEVSSEGINYAFYYDALEVMDYFVMLNGGEEDDKPARND